VAAPVWNGLGRLGGKSQRRKLTDAADAGAALISHGSLPRSTLLPRRPACVTDGYVAFAVEATIETYLRESETPLRMPSRVCMRPETRRLMQAPLAHAPLGKTPRAA